MYKFDITVDEIKSLYDKSVSEFEEKIKNILSIKKEDRNFNNTVASFENALADLNYKINIPIFLGYVSTDPDIRNAATDLELKMGKYFVDIFTREDIFNAIDEYSKNIKENLDEVDKRLLDKIIYAFKKNGLYGDEKTRKKVKKLLKDLVELEVEFSKNIRETRDYIEVDEKSLDGLDENYKKRLKKNENGKYIISTDYPDYIPFMDNSKDDNARKVLEIKFNNRCYPQNVELLEKAIKIRRKIAKLLGYDNFADYVLEDRMAKNSDKVFEFLKNLYKDLKKKGKKELKVLLKLKNKEMGSDDKTLYNWQWRYYANMYKKENFSVDYEKLREYFPLEVVIDGMFDVFSKFFGVRFIPKELPKWHSDVRTYEVCDSNNKLIAYFYFDLFPRDGKYKHAACFGLVKGRELPDGSYQIPAAAIVSNFTPPSQNMPSLLKFDEVVTLFHEFGHVTHNIFTRSKYSFFAGTSVSRDFVEVPSQVLENWVYDKDVLKKISSHYITKEPIDDKTIEKLTAARNATSGLFYLRQLFFALIDMVYHTKKSSFDTTKVYEKLMKKIFMIPMTEGTHPQASFGHIMGGYEAGYYSYLWSEVISSDFFEEFKKNGIFNPEVGKRYIDKVLSRGGSIDEEMQVKEFLGREVSNQAFLKRIGIIN
jgi:thimet oligopeptidase